MVHTSIQSECSRRQFLNTAGKSAIALSAAGAIGDAAALQDKAQAPAAADAAPEGKPLGWALVGIGSLTLGQLLPALTRCRHSKLAALVSSDPEKASSTADKYGLDHRHLYSYENFEKLAGDDTVDIVYIVLPNGMHAEYTIRAAKAGKHVFCEKPMANNAAECRQMIDACNAAGKKLGIGYRMQFEPHTLHAIELIRSGVLGKPRLIQADKSFRIRPGGWRLDRQLAGGGPLMDIGIYCLNAARYLSGEEPVEIAATLNQPADDERFKEVEESCAFTMRFPSGILAACTTTYAAAPSVSRFRVQCTGGIVEMDPAFSYGGLKLRVHRDGSWQDVQQPVVNHFVAEMDAFSRSILGNEPFRCPGEEGLTDMQCIDAIYKSAREGKTIRL